MSGIIAVTNVTIRIPSYRRNERFLGYADIELGGMMVVHDARVILSAKGRVVVKLPDRPDRTPCPTCLVQVTQAANYCHHCGEEMPPRPEKVRHRDVIHPIHPDQRAAIENAVLIAYAKEMAPPLRVVSA